MKTIEYITTEEAAVDRRGLVALGGLRYCKAIGIWLALAIALSMLVGCLSRQGGGEQEGLAAGSCRPSSRELSVFFDTGSAAVSAQMREKLKLALAQPDPCMLWTQPSLPENSRQTQVCLMGFADSEGSERNDSALARQRAINVGNALISLGLPGTRLMLDIPAEPVPMIKKNPYLAGSQLRRVDTYSCPAFPSRRAISPPVLLPAGVAPS